MRIGLSIFLREDGRWEARYRKGRKADGKIIYGSVYASTREEAEQKRIAALNELAKNESKEEQEKRTKSMLATVNPTICTGAQSDIGNSALVLDDQMIASLESALEECSDGVRVVLLMSLYMGISFSEACVLKYSDIDLENSRVNITKYLLDCKEGETAIGVCRLRSLRILSSLRYLLPCSIDDGMSEINILTGTVNDNLSLKKALNRCRQELKQNGFDYKLIPESLQATFIRRSLESGINIETVAELTGKDSGAIRRKFGQFIRSNPYLAEYLFSASCENTIDLKCYGRVKSSDDYRRKELNLLIFGADKCGRAVYDVANSLGVFNKIRFLDDNLHGDEVIGDFDQCDRYVNEYPVSFIAVEDNIQRRELAEKAIASGYIIPKLISSDATIAQDAHIGYGSVIMPHATVTSGAVIGNFTVVESECMIGTDSILGDYVYCNCDSVIMRGAVVDKLSHIKSGEIVRSKSKMI